MQESNRTVQKPNRAVYKTNCIIPKGNLSVQKVYDSLCKIRPKTTKKKKRIVTCNGRATYIYGLIDHLGSMKTDADYRWSDKVNLFLDFYIMIKI